MRKSIFAGLGLALALAGGVAAQEPGTGAPRRDRGGDHRAHKGQGGPALERGRGGPAGFLLRGITLSEAQKTQLKTLRESQHEKMQANRDAMRKQKDDVRAARQRGDTAAARAILQRNRDAMVKEREQHVTAIRNVLTAEQRVQFDKNVAELKARETKRADKFGRDGRRGPRGSGAAGFRRG